ncbi:MAG: GxxExxY protein [Halofilum sp. (in: g-proteobacteria)]|nr:GxxExxY protein [Halofilum sp. (in: g-proteobacteria)]
MGTDGQADGLGLPCPQGWITLPREGDMARRSEENLLWEQTRAIAGCAMEVLNELGHGLLEKPYERALAVELGCRAIPYRQQPRYAVAYKGQPVGEFVPDLVVFDRIVVDTKVVDRLTDHEIGQVLNYLRITLDWRSTSAMLPRMAVGAAMIADALDAWPARVATSKSRGTILRSFCVHSAVLQGARPCP